MKSDPITIKTFIDFDLTAYPQMVFSNSNFGQFDMSFQVIPEPTTLLLLGLGAVMIRKKRRP